jgi:hypothetical protein
MCGHDYVLCICVVETCMWMWMNNHVLRLMCCVLKFKSGHIWLYDQLYVDKIVFCILLWIRLACGCEWTTVWLWFFFYCELFWLQLPFPDQFRAILLGFICFWYTGIYRSLSVSDFPIYRFRPNKKYADKNGQAFSDHYRLFSPLVVTIWGGVCCGPSVCYHMRGYQHAVIYWIDIICNVFVWFVHFLNEKKEVHVLSDC